MICRIKSVAVNPAWEKKKLAVTLAADRTVKLWNIEDYVMQLSHRAHTVSMESRPRYGIKSKCCKFCVLFNNVYFYFFTTILVQKPLGCADFF